MLFSFAWNRCETQYRLSSLLSISQLNADGKLTSSLVLLNIRERNSKAMIVCKMSFLRQCMCLLDIKVMKQTMTNSSWHFFPLHLKDSNNSLIWHKLLQQMNSKLSAAEHSGHCWSSMKEGTNYIFHSWLSPLHLIPSKLSSDPQNFSLRNQSCRNLFLSDHDH